MRGSGGSRLGRSARWSASWAIAIVAAVSILIGCEARPPAAHYVAVLDELMIPAGWELAFEGTREPGSDFISCEPLTAPDCPSAHRYYLVRGEPAAAYGAAKQMLLDAGFAIDEEYRPLCDGGRTGGAACRIQALRPPDAITVQLSDPGQDVEESHIAKEGHSVVAVQAYGSAALEGVR